MLCISVNYAKSSSCEDKDSSRVKFSRNDEIYIAQPNQIHSRVVLPWKPSELSNALIVLRRRRKLTDEYVEDLRVRRNFVICLLKALSKKGNWREHRGEEPMHMYYTDFDWLDETTMIEVLPDDGIPDTLTVHDIQYD